MLDMLPETPEDFLYSGNAGSTLVTARTGKEKLAATTVVIKKILIACTKSPLFGAFRRMTERKRPIILHTLYFQFMTPMEIYRGLRPILLFFLKQGL